MSIRSDVAIFSKILVNSKNLKTQGFNTLKIAYIITRSDVIGGASVHLLDLASGVQKAGNDVTLLIGGDGIIKDIAKSRGLNCITINHLVREISIRKDILSFLEIKKILAKINPDIVHAHSSKAGILGRLAAKSLKIPAVFTAHGWAFSEGVPNKTRKFYIAIERFMTNFSNRIITVSDYDKKLALKNKIGCEKLLTTIHNGMPAIERNATKIINKNVKLIMVARFEEPKNQRAVIESLSSIKHLNWSAEFVGDGPLLTQNKQLASSLNLSDRIFFSGARSDIPDRLNSADIFILISKWEGLPLTILEAMRSSLPVIASCVGGIPEAVDQGKTGYLIDRDDSHGLTNALARLIESSNLRSAMGVAGKNKFNNNFTFDTMLKKTIGIYLDILKKR